MRGQLALRKTRPIRTDPACRQCGTGFDRQESLSGSAGSEQRYVCLLCGAVHRDSEGGLGLLSPDEVRWERMQPDSDVREALEVRRLLLSFGTRRLFRVRLAGGGEATVFDPRSHEWALETMRQLRENRPDVRWRRVADGFCGQGDGETLTLQMQEV